ncbi:MAG: hypothetical protein K0S55_1121, partial [Clostridia bacterium]|nr:hypothetical protein [Clostridia bacterium]
IELLKPVFMKENMNLTSNYFIGGIA